MQFGTKNLRQAGPILVRVAGVVAAFIFSAHAQESLPPEAKEELRFASGLIRLGFPDYAQKVVDALLRKHPAASADIAAIRMEILTSRGRFDEAKELLKAMPSNSMEEIAMRLKLADAYYVWGRISEARAIYDAFFKQYTNGPPPALSRFYAESAYRYAQMLQLLRDQAGALEALKYVLLANPERDEARTVRIEMAELHLKLAENAPPPVRAKHLEEARKLCQEVQWGAVDIPFGKSVVLLAHIDILNNNKAQARKTIDEYLPILKGIDDALREEGIPLKHSPMAECRYLLGLLYEEEGRALMDQKKDEEGAKALALALRHLYAVFLQYPGSSRALDAARRADELIKHLRTRGRRVQAPPINIAALVQEQFKEARALFQTQQYDEAIGKYLEALNLYPDYGGSATALGELAQCYIQVKNPRFAKAVIAYLAERFSRNTNAVVPAGNALIGVAQAYREQGDREAENEVYELFFSRFPGHPRAAAVIFRFGEEHLRAESYRTAMDYYRRVIEEYPKQRLFVDALSRMAYCYTMLGEHTNAIEWLTRYLAELPPSAEQINARLRLADAYRAANQLVQAINEYGRIVALLKQEGARFAASAEEAARNRRALEAALFWRASCYARLKQPENQLPTYRARAVEGFTEFLTEFPKSPLAPHALSSMGLMQELLGRPDEAERTYARLAREYPDSEQAKNVIFARGRALLEIGQPEKAIAVFEEMFVTPEKFTGAQFLQVGQAMVEAGQYEAAVKAFDLARAAGEQREVWEPAMMGLGRAYAAIGNHAKAVEAIETLLQKYPNSGYTVEANFILSRGYAELGRQAATGAERFQAFNAAIKAMNTVRRFSKEPDVRARAEVELGEIQLLMGDEMKAIASFLRLVLLADKGNPKVVPYYERALEQVVPLLLKTERFADAIESCEGYLKALPQGRLAEQVRQWRDEAKMRATATGSTAGPPSATTAGAVP